MRLYLKVGMFTGFGVGLLGGAIGTACGALGISGKYAYKYIDDCISGKQPECNQGQFSNCTEISYISAKCGTDEELTKELNTKAHAQGFSFSQRFLEENAPYTFTITPLACMAIGAGVGYVIYRVDQNNHPTFEEVDDQFELGSVMREEEMPDLLVATPGTEEMPDLLVATPGTSVKVKKSYLRECCSSLFSNKGRERLLAGPESPRVPYESTLSYTK